MSSASFNQRIAAIKAHKEARQRANAAAQSPVSGASSAQPAVFVESQDATTSDQPCSPVHIVTVDDVTPENDEVISIFMRHVLKEPTMLQIIARYGVSVMLAKLEKVAKEDFPQDQWFITRQQPQDTHGQDPAAKGAVAPQSILSRSDDVFLFGSSTEFAGKK